jgi:hypothetical protein
VVEAEHNRKSTDRTGMGNVVGICRTCILPLSAPNVLGIATQPLGGKPWTLLHTRGSDARAFYTPLTLGCDVRRSCIREIGNGALYQIERSLYPHCKQVEV